jgi:serine protease Do
MSAMKLTKDQAIPSHTPGNFQAAFLVPTLRVGTRAPTLCVPQPAWSACAFAAMQHVAARWVGVLVMLVGAVALSAARPALVLGQEPSAAQALAALEETLVDSIAKAERSVVAIGRVRKPKDAPGSAAAELGGVRGAFDSENEGDPTRPGFMPHEYGTGVVVDSTGLILTSYHVLGEIRDSEYWVWSAGKPYRATVRAADPWLDIAVLKTDAVGLQPMPLGDASSLKKGQIVIALGNPHAIARDGQPSAAWGIISNLSRLAPSAPAALRPTEGRETLHHYGTLIQTDARLEHGTSGGALVNLKGEMIGLTTSLAALSGSERPGGFAIPIDEDFRRALNTLKTGRMPDYGFLGVAPTHLSADLRRTGRTGARILDVVPATPAAKSGLEVGDVITHIEGEPVQDEVHLIRRLSGLPADMSVNLTIERGSLAGRPGRKLNTKVTLSKKRVEGPRQPYAEVADPAWRGLHIDYSTASPLFRDQSRDLDPEGSVAVLDVDRDSLAWKAGFRPGDFVSHVGKTRVTTPKQFRDAVGAQRGPVTMRLTAVDSANSVRTIEPDTP